MYAIETKNLTKKYGSYKACDGISIKISEGAIYGLIGRNGAGKTTLMKMLVNLINPTDGELSILDSSDKQELELARNEVGCLIETPTFNEHMSAYDNLKIRGLLMGNVDKENMEEILRAVDLYDVRNHKVSSFSLGMHQRLGIACALLNNPKVLILDEPTNGLDPVATMQVREALEKVVKKNKTTILISTHILGELEKIATNYGFIDKGKLIKEISKSDLEKSKMTLEDYFVDAIKGGEDNE